MEVTLIDSMGGDLSVVNSARVSFGKKKKKFGKGDERLISSGWIKKMRLPSENNTSYGYMWWLNRGQRKWDGLPENIYYGSGFGGNYVVVVPDHDLVIIARWIDSSKIGEFVNKVVGSHK